MVIRAIHRGRRLAITDDDRVGEIVTWLDADGEEIDDACCAVGAIVKFSEREWVPISLADFSPAETH